METGQISGLTSSTPLTDLEESRKVISEEDIHQKRFQIWRDGFDCILSRVFEIENSKGTASQSTSTLNADINNADSEKTTVPASTSSSSSQSTDSIPPVPQPGRSMSNSVDVNLVSTSKQSLGQDLPTPASSHTNALHGPSGNGYVGLPGPPSAKASEPKLDILEKMMKEFDEKGSSKNLFTSPTAVWQSEGNMDLKEYLVGLKTEICEKFQPTESVKNMFQSFIAIRHAAAMAVNHIRKLKRSTIEGMLDADFKNIEQEFGYAWIKRNSYRQNSTETKGDDAFCEFSLMKAFGSEWEKYYEEKKTERMGHYQNISEQLKKYEDKLLNLLDQVVCCDEAKLEAYSREEFEALQVLLDQDLPHAPVGEKLLQIIEDINDSLKKINAERARNESKIAQKAIRHALAKYCEIVEPKIVQPLHYDMLKSMLDQVGFGIVQSFYEVQGFVYTQPWIDKKVDLEETLQREHMEFVRVNNTNLRLQRIEIESMIQSYITTLRRKAIQLLSGDNEKSKIVDLLNSIIYDGAAALKVRYPNRAEEIIDKLRSRAVETMNTLAINDPSLVIIKQGQIEKSVNADGGEQQYEGPDNTSDAPFPGTRMTEAVTVENSDCTVTTVPQRTSLVQGHCTPSPDAVPEPFIPVSAYGGTSEIEPTTTTCAPQHFLRAASPANTLQTSLQSSICSNPVSEPEISSKVNTVGFNNNNLGGPIRIPAPRRRLSAPGNSQATSVLTERSPVVVRILRTSSCLPRPAIPEPRSQFTTIRISNPTGGYRLFRPIHQILPVRRQLVPAAPASGRKIYLVSKKVSEGIPAPANSIATSPYANSESQAASVSEPASVKLTGHKPIILNIDRKRSRSAQEYSSSKRIQSTEREHITLDNDEEPKVPDCSEPVAKKQRKWTVTRNLADSDFMSIFTQSFASNIISEDAAQAAAKAVITEEPIVSELGSTSSSEQVLENLPIDYDSLNAIGGIEPISVEELLSANTTIPTDELLSTFAPTASTNFVNESDHVDECLNSTNHEQPDMNVSVASVVTVSAHDTMSFGDPQDADNTLPINFVTLTDDSMLESPADHTIHVDERADDPTSKPAENIHSERSPDSGNEPTKTAEIVPEDDLSLPAIAKALTSDTAQIPATDHPMPSLSPAVTDELIARAESVLGSQSETENESDAPPDLSSIFDDVEEDVNTSRITSPLAQHDSVGLPQVLETACSDKEGLLPPLRNTCPEPEVESRLKMESNAASDSSSAITGINATVFVPTYSKKHNLSKLKLSSPYGVGIFFCETKIYIAVTVYKTVRSFTLSSKIRLLQSESLTPELILDSEPDSPDYVTLDVYLFLTEPEFAETEEKFAYFEKVSKALWAEQVLAMFLHKVRDEIQNRWTKDVTPDVITVGLPTFVSSRCKQRLKTALSVVGFHKSIFVQATTGIGVSYLRSPLTLDEHYCLMVYIEDIVQNVALLRVQDGKFEVIATEGSVCHKQEVPVAILNNVTLAINSVISTAGISVNQIRYCACVLEVDDKSRVTVNGQDVVKTEWAGSSIRNDLPESCSLEVFNLADILLGGLVEISESCGISGTLEDRYSEVFSCGVKLRRVSGETGINDMELVRKNGKADDIVIRVPAVKLGSLNKRSPIYCYHYDHKTKEVDLFASPNLRSNDPKASVKITVSSEGIISTSIETCYLGVQESDWKREVRPFPMPASAYRIVKQGFEEFVVASRERKFRVSPPKKVRLSSSSKRSEEKS